MKKVVIALIVLSLLIMGSMATAGPRLEFELNAIENSLVKSFGATYSDIACQVTHRTGTGNTVLELQGSIVPSISNDLAWTAIANSIVVNATTATTNNNTWHFQSLEDYVSAIRMHVLSGVGASNTVEGQCVPGGR